MKYFICAFLAIFGLNCAYATEDSFNLFQIPEGNGYIKLLGGAAMTKEFKSRDPYASYAFAFGYEMELDTVVVPFVEIEIAHHHSKAKFDPKDEIANDLSFKTNTAFVNIGTFFRFNDKIRPYVGIGFGYFQQELNMFIDNMYLYGSSKRFGYHFNGGIEYAIHNDYSLGAEYKFIGAKNMHKHHVGTLHVKRYF